MPLEILSARRARARKTCRWNVTRRRLLRSRMTQVRGGSLVSTRGYLSGNPVPARSLLDPCRYDARAPDTRARGEHSSGCPNFRARQQSAASLPVSRQNGPDIGRGESSLSQGFRDDREASGKRLTRINFTRAASNPRSVRSSDRQSARRQKQRGSRHRHGLCSWPIGIRMSR